MKRRLREKEESLINANVAYRQDQRSFEKERNRLEHCFDENVREATEARKELEHALDEEKEKMKLLQEEHKDSLRKNMLGGAFTIHFQEAIRVLNSEGISEMSRGYKQLHGIRDIDIELPIIKLNSGTHQEVDHRCKGCGNSAN